MRLYKDYIINHIKETKFPIWYLYSVQGYKRVPIMFFMGDTFTEDETADSKVQKSIDRLESILQNLPADAVLCIELKSNARANQSTALGPFEFWNHEKNEEAAAATVPALGGQFPGLVGLPAAPAGYVSEETLNGKLEALRVDNERKLNDLMYKYREKEFEEKMQREREELKQLRKELNDEKKKYESNTGAAAETLVFALKKIISEFFPALKRQAAAAPAAALQGVNQQQSEEPTPDPGDAKYKAVEELATRLYENPNIKESDIRGIIEHMSQPAAQTVEPQKTEAA